MFALDETQEVLIDYLSTTEQIIIRCLNQYDKTSEVLLRPALDIGFPHDVIRLAGGFATGMYAEWNCSILFVPVDTTVNVCSVSTYEMADEIELTQEFIDEIDSRLVNSVFSMNFHKGNHFISFIKGEQSKKNYLLLHSSAVEFRGNFNGLYPVKDNWYYDRMKTFHSNGRYLRYLIGEDAVLFFNLSEALKQFNKTRHDFFAHILTNGIAKISSNKTWHHYEMPNNSAVNIGSTLVDIGETFPILTKLGSPIIFLKVNKLIESTFDIKGKLLVPHGWGKKSIARPTISFDFKKNVIKLNGTDYAIEYGTSLGKDKSFIIRDYEIDEYLAFLKKYYEFTVIEKYNQLLSYSKQGLIKW